MKIINMVCPSCGASIQIDADKKKTTCEYCGNNLYIDDGVLHVQYDNVEEAGYKFEKGRQRAQAESRNPQSRQQVHFSPNQPPKKKRTWLWVLGWIFIFPVPLTILLLKNKTLDKKVKYIIMAVAWIIFLIIAFSGRGINDNTPSSPNENNNTTSVVQGTSADIATTVKQETESGGNTTDNTAVLSEDELQQESSDITETDSSDSLTQEGAIEALVEKFNVASDDKLVFSEDFVVSNKDSWHYRTEFRLGVYNDAVGKSYNYSDKTVDIVSTKSYFGEIDIRVYSDGITLNQSIELIKHVSPLLDITISDETIAEAINYVTEYKEANGYYYGKLGLSLLGNDTKGYELMIKTD